MPPRDAPGARSRAAAASELACAIGHTFARPALLEQALTHGSRAHEQGDLAGSNERLEFLGDAVLDLVISELLMQAHPDAPEGGLSVSRAALVNAAALAERARHLELGRYVRLGRTEERGGGSEKQSILANVFEALLGALYLDAGLAPVRALVAREFADGIARSGEPRPDPKTRLQEVMHAAGETNPAYRVTDECGPPHLREFEVEVRLGARVLGRAVGSSKRAAEREAARCALESLGEDAGE